MGSNPTQSSSWNLKTLAQNEYHIYIHIQIYIYKLHMYVHIVHIIIYNSI